MLQTLIKSATKVVMFFIITKFFGVFTLINSNLRRLLYNKTS